MKSPEILQNMSRIRTISGVILLIILAITITYAVTVHSFPDSQNTTIIQPGSMNAEAAYVISTDGAGNWYVRNGQTGEVRSYSGSDATQAISSTICSNEEIFLKNGTYPIDQLNLISLNNFAMVGSGPSTILQPLSQATKSLISVTNCSGIRIRSMMFCGGNTTNITGNPSVYAVETRGSTDVEISDNNAYYWNGTVLYFGTSGTGYDTNNSCYIRVINNHFSWIRSAIFLNSTGASCFSQTITITDDQFTDEENQGHGNMITIQDTQDVFIDSVIGNSGNHYFNILGWSCGAICNTDVSSSGGGGDPLHFEHMNADPASNELPWNETRYPFHWQISNCYFIQGRYGAYIEANRIFISNTLIAYNHKSGVYLPNDHADLIFLESDHFHDNNCTGQSNDCDIYIGTVNNTLVSDSLLESTKVEYNIIILNQTAPNLTRLYHNLNSTTIVSGTPWKQENP